MKISYGLAHQNFSDKNGYGYAAKMMLKSLDNMREMEVNFLDPTAPVQIWFGQPEFWTWNPGQYRIAYLPWESTALPDGWVDAMNEVDEVWTPSGIVANWFEEAGVKVPIKVYLHGVEPAWGLVSRKWYPGKTFNVFHHGAESHRKNVKFVQRAFFDVLGDVEEARLNLKMNMKGFHVPEGGRVKYLNERLERDDLIDLYCEQHLMIYPSYGEGFGLTPIQAVATGMPVLITGGWAPYEKFLPKEFIIDSKLGPSPFPDVHPGQMWIPDYDDLIDKFTFIVDHYSYAAEIVVPAARTIKQTFDWDAQTRHAFKDLKKL